MHSKILVGLCFAYMDEINFDCRLNEYKGAHLAQCARSAVQPFGRVAVLETHTL